MHIYYFLFCFLLAAMLMDIWCYKVKNRFLLSGFAIGILILFNEKGIESLGKGLLTILLLFLILLPMFAIRIMGAADVKLFLLLGFLLGVKAAIACIFLSLVAGAVYSLLQMLYYKNLFLRLSYFCEYTKNLLITGHFQPYHKGQPDKKAVIHFTIPIFISFCIYWIGGVSWMIF